MFVIQLNSLTDPDRQILLGYVKMEWKIWYLILRMYLKKYAIFYYFSKEIKTT